MMAPLRPSAPIAHSPMVDTIMIPFICAECGGKVDMRPPQDDFRTIRKNGELVSMPIPTNVMIPKCGYCGETYFGQTDSDRVAAVLGADPRTDT